MTSCQTKRYHRDKSTQPTSMTSLTLSWVKVNSLYFVTTKTSQSSSFCKLLALTNICRTSCSTLSVALIVTSKQKQLKLSKLTLSASSRGSRGICVQSATMETVQCSQPFMVAVSMRKPLVGLAQSLETCTLSILKLRLASVISRLTQVTLLSNDLPQLNTLIMIPLSGLRKAFLLEQTTKNGSWTKPKFQTMRLKWKKWAALVWLSCLTSLWSMTWQVVWLRLCTHQGLLPAIKVDMQIDTQSECSSSTAVLKLAQRTCI